MKTQKDEKRDNRKRRRVIRINEETYEALLEIQRMYEKEIGIKPLLIQLLEKAVADLFKIKSSIIGSKEK